MESQKKKYKKHKSPEEALKAIKQCQKQYYEQHKETYQIREREKYRKEHPDHKVYTKRDVIEYTRCQGKSANNKDCTRKVKVDTQYCWQHQPKNDISIELDK